MKIVKILIILIFSLGSLFSKAQYGTYDTIRVHAYIDKNGDTIPEEELLPVIVYTNISKKWKAYWEQWTRLRNAVYITYPYSIATSKIINELNERLKNVHSQKERKKIIKSREKELKKEFADKLTKLSIYQGKILMKLIYRETNNNCYEIIKEFKGSFSAFFWQSIAVLFGANLKQTYDKDGADKEIEPIVLSVQKMYGY